MKDTGAQNLCEKKVISLQDDCVHHTLDRIIKKKSTPRYLAVKLQNVHDQNKKDLKAIKGKIPIRIKGIKIIITEDVSVMMGIKSLTELYLKECMKNNGQPRILHLANLELRVNQTF